MSRRLIPAFVAGAVVVGFSGLNVAHAVQVQVTIENLAPAGGVALSPFFLAAHDGTFDAFDAGAAASAATQNVAEFGNGGPQIAAFNSAYPAGVATTLVATTNAFGPGIFLPGGAGSVVLTLDPSLNRYLSFGAMVVPSNDFFLGNDSPTAVQLFDAGGNFVASTLTLTGTNIWDAGTEVNAPFGAAFTVGQDATDHVAEGGLITPGGDFTPYAGAATAAGYSFTSAPAAGSPVARISFAVVPEPATFATAALLALPAFLGRRRHMQ